MEHTQNDHCLLQEAKLREDLADLKLQLEEVNLQVQEGKEQDAALDDLLKHKQELIQERDNQVLPYSKLVCPPVCAVGYLWLLKSIGHQTHTLLQSKL